MLEWTDPPFSAGHWLPELVTLAGGTPVLSEAGARSVRVEWDALEAADATALVIAPCGFGLDDAISQAQVVLDRPETARFTRVAAVDSSAYFVRGGPRIVEGIESLAWFFHPEAFDRPPTNAIALLRGGDRET